MTAYFANVNCTTQHWIGAFLLEGVWDNGRDLCLSPQLFMLVPVLEYIEKGSTFPFFSHVSSVSQRPNRCLKGQYPESLLYRFLNMAVRV